MPMFTEETITRVDERQREWEKILEKTLARAPERLERFSTVSDEEIKRIYTPADISSLDFDRDLSFPGMFPFTRGVQPSMHRGRL
ncbi:MAG: methylmalonyl-CoA mutase, partial [Deltaproteobacteria bacterium]|nr:methylmalonyl-CoA mutase [Deltaproteobacteria bacterium]